MPTQAKSKTPARSKSEWVHPEGDTEHDRIQLHALHARRKIKCSCAPKSETVNPAHQWSQWPRPLRIWCTELVKPKCWCCLHRVRRVQTIRNSRPRVITASYRIGCSPRNDWEHGELINPSRRLNARFEQTEPSWLKQSKSKLKYGCWVFAHPSYYSANSQHPYARS